MLVGERAHIGQMNVSAHDDVGARVRPRPHRRLMAMQQIFDVALPNDMHRLMRHHDAQLLRRRGSELLRDMRDLAR